MLLRWLLRSLAQVTRHAAIPITLRGVAKAYGTTLALDHVDLDVRSGEFLTLLGPSGSGKTTLLMVLAGFIRPDQGSLRFGDQEVIRLAPHKRDVGMVFQNYALFPHIDVAANIAFPLKLRGVAQAGNGAARRQPRWRWSSSAASARAGSTSSPAASASASRWRARSCSSRASC